MSSQAQRPLSLIMKTDRFTDIIRRKLESIRPEFTENDWTKMQASLQQAAPPSSSVIQHPASRGWLARPWVPLTAAASVAALVAVAAWQRSEIATLRQTVQTLSYVKPAATQSHSADLANQTTPPVVHQTDTVYITRYVPVPAKASSATEPAESRGQWADASAPVGVDRQERSVASVPESQTQRRSVSGATDVTPLPTSPETTGNTDGQLAVNHPNRAINERTTEQPTQSATSGTGKSQSDVNLPGTNVTTSEESGIAASRTKTQRERLRSSAGQSGQPVANGAYSEPSATELPGQLNSTPTEPTNISESALAANFDQLVDQPLQLTDTDWNTMLLRKASRRMRPVRTVTVGGTQAPASQSVAKFTPRFRIGVGGDLTTRSRSTAITGELIVGKHWTLGVGYGQSTCSDGNFLSEKDFNMKNPQPFRKEFDKAVDPKFEPFIANITLKREQKQLPLQIGYRIPLTSSFTILPTVGTTLTLSNVERLTFDRIEKQFVGLEIIRNESSRSRPYDVFNNLTFGTAVEWQKNHWVAQAGPLATTQLARVSGPNAYSSVNLGARVRLFYQF